MDFGEFFSRDSKFAYYKQWQINIAIVVGCVIALISKLSLISAVISPVNFEVVSVLIWWMKFGGYEENVPRKRQEVLRKLAVVNERIRRSGSAVSYGKNSCLKHFSSYEKSKANIAPSSKTILVA